MKDIKRYVFLIIGCLVVALNYNLFVIPNNLITFGFSGVSALVYYSYDINPAMVLLFFNLVMLFIATIILKHSVNKQFFISSLLIPLFIFITFPITNYYVVDLPEILLTLIVTGVVGGFGYSIIYKYGFQAENSFLFEELMGKILKFHSNLYSWIIDIIVIVITFIVYGYEICLYSLVVIIIMRYMIRKVKLGINDYKCFYIITNKEKEVKNYILHDLKYELTVMDVRGGFTKKSNKILFTVIAKKDYYQLKEGIKLIDNKAFIAITDTYDLVNGKVY